MVTDASFCQIDCAFVSCWCVLQYWSVIAEGVVNVVDVTTFLAFEPLLIFSVFNWMLMIFNFLHNVSPKSGLFDSKYCLNTGAFGSSNKPVSADQHGLRWEKWQKGIFVNLLHSVLSIIKSHVAIDPSSTLIQYSACVVTLSSESFSFMDYYSLLWSY